MGFVVLLHSVIKLKACAASMLFRVSLSLDNGSERVTEHEDSSRQPDVLSKWSEVEKALGSDS